MKLGLVAFILTLFTKPIYSADALPPSIEKEDVSYLEAQEQKNFSGYKSNYFIYGHNSTKLQFSFKYQIVKRWNLYLGYTQLMFWDLEGKSKPFRDINHNPELFHRIEIDKGYIKTIDASPFQHVSNGRDGLDSRSYNSAYVQINMADQKEAKSIRLSTRFSYIYNLDIQNRDIGTYYGPVDVRLVFVQFAPWILNRGEMYVQIRPGGNWKKGNQELGLSFRANIFGLNPSIFMQLQNGYAESLVTYSHRETRFRIGFLL